MESVPDVPVDSAKGNTAQNPRIRWCFTLHDYTTEEEVNIVKMCSEWTKFFIFAREQGKSGNTKHLQGYMEFKVRKRMNTIKKEFNIDRLHLEGAKGSKLDNIIYCKKEYTDYCCDGRWFYPIKPFKKFYTWEENILLQIKGEADDRTINWFWESKGGVGKSAFIKYLCAKQDALLISNKGSDMKYGIVKYREKRGFDPKLILIDIPRSVDTDYFSYTAVEEIKNGCFYSCKYESEMVIMPSPHIYIFANERPDERKLSSDRWNIVKIK